MIENRITAEQAAAFADHLRAEERSPGTIENYLRHVRAFAAWPDGPSVSKKPAVAWKAHLVDRGNPAATVNAILTSLNQFFSFQGWPECRVRILRVQRRLFRDSGSELTRPEYDRLVDAAQAAGKERLALLMETICSTGIRVSEVQYITVQAAYRGRAEISLKGKIRVIMLPGRLCRKLLKYAKKQKIVSGEIFLTRNKTSLSRRQIWAELKHLCRYAGVEPAKVFPHNLRHLFAVIFYRACKDISRLADVLGHSSIETTRIYLVTSGTEHARQLEQLRLVL